MFGALATKTHERRRSIRASMCVDLIVYGDEGRWQERTCALSLNAHGVLVALGTHVKVGQKVAIGNPANLAIREGRVVGLGRSYGRRTEIAIEFEEPAPDFWYVQGNRVEFSPIRPKAAH